MNKTYLAITIGPIYKTMQMARKTREFWGASMLFSLLAKELCQSLKNEGVKDDAFLVPHKSILSKPVKNVGLYLDRVVCCCEESIYMDIEKKVISPALERLSNSLQKVTDTIKSSDLKSYFKINAIFKECISETPLNEIFGFLNTMELYSKDTSEDILTDKLKHFLENVNTEYDDNSVLQANNFLTEYFTLNDINGNIRIPSITEISTVELFENNSSTYRNILNTTIWKKTPDENKLFINLKEAYPNDVRNLHKYFCIVQADGDKLGNALMHSNTKEVDGISADLVNWSKEALQALIDYGALPIYIGGDDLLCFAPVRNKDKNILDIAEQLTSSYVNYPGLKSKSTLSIALKIAYYKSPMYESYSDTFSMLKEAKKMGGGYCCINLEKHSGQPHQLSYSFLNDYTLYIKAIESNMLFSNKEKSFLNSVMYTLRANEELIYLVCNDPDRLWYFFANNFDEARKEKTTTAKYKYLHAISTYLFYLFSIHGDRKDTDSQQYVATVQLYSVLKIIRFIKGLDDDKD